MINKEKIAKLDIYDENGKHVLTTKSFAFPRDFFKIKGYELVSIKGNSLPVIKKDEKITVIFQYLNSTRIQCTSKVDISTAYQLNFHVDEGVVLEERRGSYKVETCEPAYIVRIDRDDDVIDLEEEFKVTVLNINLTGIFMKCDMELKVGDVVTLRLLPDADNMELQTEILRRQLDSDGNFLGYGCRFVIVTQPDEERIARHLLECQQAQRERRKNESR